MGSATAASSLVPLPPSPCSRPPYKPEGQSYYHWAIPTLPEVDAVKAFVGVVLLIGWTVFLRAATRSIGVFGFVLAAGLFDTLIWMGIQYEYIQKDNPRMIRYVSMLAFAGVPQSARPGHRPAANSRGRSMPETSLRISIACRPQLDPRQTSTEALS